MNYKVRSVCNMSTKIQSFCFLVSRDFSIGTFKILAVTSNGHITKYNYNVLLFKTVKLYFKCLYFIT